MATKSINDTKQYLDDTELKLSLPIYDIKVDDLGATDTYNETKIVAKIKELGDANIKLLYKAALQIAIIGSGNKNYGFVRDDSGNIVTLDAIFKKCNVLYLNDQNAKLKDDTLTARRLTRVYRYHIQRFIRDTGKTSYLFNKYGDKIIATKDTHLITICFPGAEHMIKTKEEIEYLILTYKNLDEAMVVNKRQLNFSFSERIRRVLIARNLINVIPPIVEVSEKMKK